MSTELMKKEEDSLRLDKNYKDFLSGIKERLKAAQIRASLAVNSELVNFYWQLGSDMIEWQKKYCWGENFLEQLSKDMRQDLPEMQGYSVTNLKRMRRIARQYPKGPQPVAQIPWGHISVLIHKVKDMEVRNWYVQAII